jgi:acetate---CoA ligase (ADP-forming)
LTDEERRSPRPRPSLDRLLRARSVAVVGASATPGTFGNALLRQLIRGEYTGTVYPVNPGRADIDGIRCYPSLADLPEPVDCALLAVADERLEEALRAVGEAGIPSAVVFGALAVAASPHPNPAPMGMEEGICTGETGSGPGEQVERALPLPDRLRSIATEGEIALLGGNAMGFYNTVDRLFVSGYPPAEPLPEGRIAFISHSGSTFSAFANNRRGLCFSYLISPGQELILTAADYLRFALAQPETRVVALFLEAVRDPEGFVAALAEAARLAIPVVALKVGRSERGRAMALAHSGALAGSDAAFRALCERWGVIQCRSLDEMADTLELLAAPRRPRAGGLALAGDSGGERALIVDRAAELGVPWASLADQTLETIGAALDPGLEAANPLDLWGSGRDWQRVYETCLAAMACDPATGIAVLAVDLVVGSRLVPGYLEAVERVFAETETPLAVLGNLASAIDPHAAARLRERGIPVLMGTDTGLAALGHALSWRPASPPASLAVETGEHASRWLAALAGRSKPLDEVEAKRLLADWGIPVVAERLVESKEEAIAAARALGWPVVLKTAAPWLLHKSDVGGVILDLEAEATVANAYAHILDRFGPLAVVQRQVSTKDRVEMFLGMTVDPQFGPLIGVGLGGIWVEVLHDVVSALAPIDQEAAAAMLARLRGASLLRGARGAPAVDLDALSDVIAAFSRMAAALGPVVDQIDVNPLLAGPEGVVAVDALIVPRPIG